MRSREKLVAASPRQSRFHYNPKLQGSAEDREFDLEYNHRALLSEAFAATARKIYGEGHGLALRLERGGAHGEADSPARESLLLLVHSPTETHSQIDEGGVDVGSGCVNAPWGVLRTPLPSVDEAMVAKRFRTILSAQGLEASSPPGWALLTVAEGG